jgi:methionyl-tRNA formyltransferase
MGTAAFAVPCLRRTAAEHEVAAVVSQPDRPRGRGLRLTPSPVKAAAGELGLGVLQPEKASAPDFVAQLAVLAPEVLVVVAYGQILRPAVLSLPERGCINVHGSLLPELRGAAPIQWAVIRDYAETGVSTMFMDAGMDTGDVILTARVPIDPQETAGELSERLAPLGADLLSRTLSQVAAGTAPRVPQDPARATYAPLLRREDGDVSWNRPAEEVRARIHGCNPAPGAVARRHGRPVKLWRAEAVAGGVLGRPGEVLSLAPLTLAAGLGALRLLEVQAENRPHGTGADFARGYRVELGEIWEDGGSAEPSSG